MQKQKKTKLIILLIVALLIAIIISLLLYKKYHNQPATQVDQGSQSQSTKNLPDGTPLENNTTNSNLQDTNKASTVAITISQITQNPNQLIVRALIDGVSDGTCKLSLQKDSQVITREGTIMKGPSYYYCSGFVINMNEILQKGVWQLQIEATSKEANGKINQEVTVK